MFKEFMSNLIDSFNPNAYSYLSAREFKPSLRFFFGVILVFSIFNFLFFLPQIISFYSDFDNNINKVDVINASFNIKTNEELKILDKPLIIIDSERDSADGEFLLITNDKVYKKGLFGYSEYSLNGFDFAKFIKSSKVKIILLMLLSLPTIFLFYFIFNLAKILFLVLITSFVVYSILKIRDRPITWKQVLNLSIYSLSILLVFKMLLWFNMVVKFWVPLAIYVVWVIIIVFLLDDSRISFVPDPVANRGSSSKKTTYTSINADANEMRKIDDLLKHSKKR